MDTRIAPGGARLDVVATDSAARVTPPVGVPFRDILASGASALLRGAQAAVTALPGAPIVAAAVRPGGLSPVASPSLLGTGSVGALGTPGVSAPAIQGSAESPTASATTGATGDAASIEGALAQSQQFNLYYLQLQEQLQAENRSYTAMSNVLKARHDTVKNAIGNIR